MISEREKLKKELWQQAEEALFALYGKTPDPRILNRFYNEKMIFGETDAIIVWDITAEIRLAARHCGHLTNMTGTDASCFVAYLMGASDINPLELHYFCPACGKIKFLENKCALPWDIADKPCACGHTMRADGFDIPYEMHIGRTKTHLTVAPPVMKIAEGIIEERVRGIYSCISRIRRKPSSSVTFIFGEKQNGNYPGIAMVSSVEYDKAKKLTDSTGVDFEEIMAGISNRYLSAERLVAEISKGETDGVLGFNFKDNPSTDRLKEDLMNAKPQNSYDLLKFLGALHGTRNWLYNANVLVKNGICKIGEIPSHRDDVFMMLRDEAKINTGIAFNITNKISKGLRSDKLTNSERDLLEHLDLPKWFISYIEKVHYMCSKATTIGMLRIALVFIWYKINYPDKFEI